uniref:Sulfotransferase family cytosolic 1B member 1-like n=1 Tax=Saccoglossus kowalevskii TaxID=10224 RepID=A0ABM0M9V8_SACKO
MSEYRPIVTVQPPWKKSFYFRPGYLLPSVANKKTIIENDVRNLTIRRDDIFIHGYVKSGTHWTTSIVEEIVNIDNPEDVVRHSQTLEMGPLDHPDLFEIGLTKDMVPVSGASVVEKRPLTRPRIMKTHLMPEFMPNTYFEKKSKTIIVTRNPKDVAVSLCNYHHITKVLEPIEWDNFIREYGNENTEYGSYFQYTIDWAKYKEEPWTMFIRYEDIKQ